MDSSEPASASRLSPYAVCAFVLSLLGIWMASQGGAFPYYLYRRALISQALAPIAATIFALVLASRAKREISASGGRLGGVGFYRSARVIAVATLMILILSVAVQAAWAGHTESVEVEVPAAEIDPFEPDRLSNEPDDLGPLDLPTAEPEF